MTKESAWYMTYIYPGKDSPRLPILHKFSNMLPENGLKVQCGNVVFYKRWSPRTQRIMVACLPTDAPNLTDTERVYADMEAYLYKHSA